MTQHPASASQPGRSVSPDLVPLPQPVGWVGVPTTFSMRPGHSPTKIGDRSCLDKQGRTTSPLVAQLDRAGGFYPQGCGFDSCQAGQNAMQALIVMHSPCKRDKTLQVRRVAPLVHHFTPGRRVKSAGICSSPLHQAVMGSLAFGPGLFLMQATQQLRAQKMKFHSILPAADQRRLIDASEQCAPHRNDPKRHAMAVQEIDVIAARIRAERPELFWSASDPVYQAMSREWEAKRQIAALVP